MAIEAYRFFSNNCREAMTYYQGVLGGELSVMSFADLPPGEDQPEGVDPNLVMHAALVFSDGDMLMASDDPSGDGGPVKGVSLHYTAASVEEAERIYAALSQGGSADMPLEEVFWALRFGSCTDKFGTAWMISVDHTSSES
jgi:PhnB protein